MPVQINEVVIRAVVDSKSCDSPDDESKDASAGSEEELLERVLEIIQESKER